MAKIESIITEWFVRLPRGYASPPYTQDELDVLGEVIRESNLDSSDIVEKVRQAFHASPPNTGNDTNLKEGLVCLFYDALRSEAGQDLIQVHTALRDRKEVEEGEIVKLVESLQKVFAQNRKNYGAGTSAPKNLVKYIDWTYKTKDKVALKKINNALSAARTIIQKVGEGIVIREEKFDRIRTLAVQLAGEYGVQGLRADNWCPGDMYILKDSTIVSKALQSDTLAVSTKSKRSLNSYFQSNQEIVAVSLKEQLAQAGKATQFLKHVFNQTFIPEPAEKEQPGVNEQTASTVSAISRYEAYMGRRAGKGRSFNPRSAIISGQGKVHATVNSILKKANVVLQSRGSECFDLVKMSTINLVEDPDQFYLLNKPLFENVDHAIEVLTEQLQERDQVSNLDQQFLDSRARFLNHLRTYNVQVQQEDPHKKLADIKAGSGDNFNVISKKTVAYDLASTIIEKWADRNKKVNDAYAKIAEVTNPFAALTAFAIASAGISPGFWKVVGSNSSDQGTAHWFDATATVDVLNTNTSPMVLQDTPGQAGFLLLYTTTIDTKSYKTVLAFRFSDSAIRIEVQRLV